MLAAVLSITWRILVSGSHLRGRTCTPKGTSPCWIVKLLDPWGFFVVLHDLNLPSGSKADSLPAELRFSLLNCSIPRPLTLPLPPESLFVLVGGGGDVWQESVQPCVSLGIQQSPQWSPWFWWHAFFLECLRIRPGNMFQEGDQAFISGWNVLSCMPAIQALRWVPIKTEELC